MSTEEYKAVVHLAGEAKTVPLGKNFVTFLARREDTQGRARGYLRPGR
jgi:hypothetical protein